jgi:phosphoribosylformylglycinamidine synthase
MVFRVEVGLKKEFKDPEGLKLQKRLSTDLKIDSVNSIRVLRTYLIDVANTNEEQISLFANEVLTDAVVEQSRTDEELANEYDFDWIIETGFRPGVTDNEGKTAIWSFFTLFKRDKSETGKIFSGRKYLISGNVSKETAYSIATKMLANNLIQRFTILSKEQWLEGKRIGNEVPVVKNSAEIKIETIDIDIDDEKLLNLSSSRVLALNLEEMQTIKDFFTDENVKEFRKNKGFPEKPTDCEIEVLAQTWSEHCKHKIFAADIEYVDETTNSSEKIHSLYKSYIKKVTNDLKPNKPWIKSVFDDNAGIIELDDDTFFAMKVETHNSPSALDPYGGSLTGIVGVNRDIIGCGMGAKPIFNTDIFCFASPFFKGELPGKNLLHPGRILRGVHRGIVDGGNESGIPVVNGSIFFDNRFIGKPLVFCGTGGFMPKKIKNKPSHLKKAQKGDFIVMTGGRVGADGIHGATFSSEELNENSPVTAVQIGDPITQKKMLDFLLEARDKLLFNAITDNGAGGLSSSIGEMAEDTNGARIDLEKIPLKYTGLQPWEIFISEAQERMSLSVPKEKFKELKELADIHEVEISEIGEFTDTGYLEIFYENKPAALLEMNFLHNGLPKYHLEAKWNKIENNNYKLELYDNYNNILLDMISRLNIASKEDWVRQYDHEVQGRSAGKPFVGKDADGPSDAAVVRTSPFKQNAVITSHGIKPTFSDIGFVKSKSSSSSFISESNIIISKLPCKSIIVAIPKGLPFLLILF